jgi:heme oxygenase
VHTIPPPTDRFTPPLLADIRAATRSLHDRIEIAPALVRLMAPDLQRPDYVAALQAKFRFHAAMQAALPPRLARLGIAWAVPSHALAALAADLAALGAAVPAVPRCPGLGRGFGPVGALYVIEGSLLGGRVIGRHVGDALGVSPGAGGSFFRGTTADDARARWRGFCDLLASLPNSARPGVTGGAARGFRFFLACLDGLGAATRRGASPARKTQLHSAPAAGAADHF